MVLTKIQYSLDLGLQFNSIDLRFNHFHVIILIQYIQNYTNINENFEDHFKNKS